MDTPAVELVVVDGQPAVRGECDLSSAADIEAFLSAFTGRTVEVDLSGVTFIDSSGLKAFLNARRRDPELRIVEPSAAVERLLRMTGTYDYLVHGTIDDEDI
jgi:anti-anti-sigma factor